MIRDMNLIRSIVLAIRDHEGRPAASEVQSLVSNVDNAIFGYHITILIQSALVTGVDTSARKDRFGVASLALTWAGQDFADNIINDGVWTSAQKQLNDADLKSASFEVWTRVAIAKITEILGNSPQ
ncbi:MAG: DUF2513 domain-containing protein [Pirellulaceae bacterium]